MHKAWRIDGRGKEAAVLATDVVAAVSPVQTTSIPPELSAEKRKQLVQSFLSQNMAAAIAAAILVDAGEDESTFQRKERYG